jgi:hypothetical protein
MVLAKNKEKKQAEMIVVVIIVVPLEAFLSLLKAGV